MVTCRADVPDPDDPKKKLPRKESIEAVFNRLLIGTGAGLQNFSMTCGGADCSGGGPAGITVTLNATFNKALFTPLFAKFFPGGNGCPAGNFCYSLSVTWVNEPFVS
jgi:hypothetical protein